MAEDEKTSPGMSSEEMAFLTKALWAALQSPTWLKDDLIDFGKAIFSKKSLKGMDDKVFDKIFPFLRQISTHLANQLAAKADEIAELAVGGELPDQEEPPGNAAASKEVSE